MCYNVTKTAFTKSEAACTNPMNTVERIYFAHLEKMQAWKMQTEKRMFNLRDVLLLLIFSYFEAKSKSRLSMV